MHRYRHTDKRLCTVLPALPFFFVGFEALVCDFHRILPIQFLIVLVDVPILSALARNFSHPTTRRMDAGPQLRTTPKSTSLFKCFIIAPNIPRQSRHRTAVHNLKFWYLLFCFITSGRCSCLFLYQQEPHFFVGSKQIKLIEMYNYPSPLAFFFFSHA